MKGEILSVVIAASIVIASSVVVVNVLRPSIESSRSVQGFNDAKNIMAEIDAIIKELMFEAAGASRSLNIKTNNPLIISGKEDKIKIKAETDVQVLDPGSRIKQGNLLLSSGHLMKAYEGDADNDGNTDLILENDAVLFAVRKIGNSSNWASINTTNFITFIKSKIADVNITPVSKIMIDGMDNSSYGTGYTELIEKNDYLTSGAIRAYVNSTSFSYEVFFALSASSDFVEMDVRRVMVK